jgi:hypothetical protein
MKLLLSATGCNTVTDQAGDAGLVLGNVHSRRCGYNRAGKDANRDGNCRGVAGGDGECE